MFVQEGATPGIWWQTVYSVCREHGTVHSPANKCTCTTTFIYLASVRSAALCAAIIYLISK